MLRRRSPSHFVFVDKLVVFVEEALQMALILLDKLGNVVLILDHLTCLVQGKFLERGDFFFTERDTLRSQELSENIDSDGTFSLWV